LRATEAELTLPLAPRICTSTQRKANHQRRPQAINGSCIAIAMELFMIACSDEQIVLMGKDRLDNLLDKMPILRFLFFGHPDMEQKQLEVRDGLRVVKIPDSLRVSKEAFLEAVHAVLGLHSLPALAGCDLDLALKPLHDTLSTLGGCDEFDNRVRVHKEQMSSAVPSNPMTPQEDVNQLYNWTTHKENTYPPDHLASQGFSFTTVFTEHGTGNLNYLLYRKRKDAP